MKNKPSVIVTGATGFLGCHLLKELRSDFEIIALSHSRDFQPLDGVIYQHIDFTEIENFKKLLLHHSPIAVFHLAAIADAHICQHQPELAYFINVLATKQITDLCHDFQVALIYTSTDLIFDGKKGFYSEQDEPFPLSVYGKQKLEAEKQIQQFTTNYCILRLPLMIGEGTTEAPGFMNVFLNNLRTQVPQNLFTDEYRSPLHVQEAAKGLVLALKNKWQGIFHLGGKEKLSRYELGLRICEHFNISNHLLHPVLQKDLKLAAPRPADVSLNSEKAYALGFEPHFYL